MRIPILVTALIALVPLNLLAESDFREIAGEVSASSAVLQARFQPEPDRQYRYQMRFQWSDRFDFKRPQNSEWVPLQAEFDYVTRYRVEKLRPNHTWFYRVQLKDWENSIVDGPQRRFNTLPAPNAIQSLAFVISSHLKLPPSAEAPDAAVAPALAQIGPLEPAFWIMAGNHVYYDQMPVATSRDAMRAKWQQLMALPELREVLNKTATFWQKNDHDFRFNNADNSSRTAPSPELGRQLFLEQAPVTLNQNDGVKTWGRLRVNRDLELWFLEARDYRRPNESDDGPAKTLLGKVQLTWLKQTLTQSDATFKLIISPTPLIGDGRPVSMDNHVAGFQHEGDEIVDFLTTSKLHLEGTFWISADPERPYHSINSLGLEEFSVPALTQAAAVARPKADNNEDAAPVFAPWAAESKVAGFLYVAMRARPNEPKAEINFVFSAEDGSTLHTVTRTRIRGSNGDRPASNNAVPTQPIIPKL